MAHRSDCNFRLNIIRHSIDPPIQHGKGSVYLFHHSTLRKEGEAITVDFFDKNYSFFSENLPDESIVCFLLEPLATCHLIAQLQNKLHYRLWVAISRKEPIYRENQLPNHHVALVVFTKNHGSFKHSKIQIEYTLCPSCGKTTKDYGGKKHLYSPYGTLMSDVWRDIKYSDEDYPEQIVARLADLFAINPYKHLHYYNYQNSNKIFYRAKPKPKNRNLHHYDGTIRSQLIQSDCLKAMRMLPENSIDFVFADPPYNIDKKYENWCDDIHIETYFRWCDQWIEAIHRILKPGRIFALINIPLWIVRHYLFAKTLFQFQDLIVWEGLGLPIRNIMPAHYGIICLSKGTAFPLSNYETNVSSNIPFSAGQSLKEWYCLRPSCVKMRNIPTITDRIPLTNIWWDIHRLKHNSKRVDHPCQLPPSLMKRLIFTFSKENETVLDPFNGAGTTSLVASMMNRKYVGIEISEKYHQIALKRHLELDEGLDPFRKKKNIPQSKNSRVKRLEKQKYKISKKDLQLEVKQIALALGRKPNKEDIKNNSKYPLQYFEDYFIDWGEVCAAIGDKGMNENLKYPKNKSMQLSFLKE